MLKVPLVTLGHTGLRVPKLGFGTVDFNEPLNLSPEKGANILAESYKLGVSFWDSSDDYGTHPHVAAALKLVPRKEIVISTKTSANHGVEAIASLRKSLKELGTDYIDIFLLHYVTRDQINGCRPVLRDLGNQKATGTVKAVGLSTHSVAVVREACELDDVDVIMTICCRASQAIIDKYPEHIPLEDGSIEEMFDAIKLAHGNGKGVVTMKVLGGRVKGPAPPLVRDYKSSIKSIAALEYVDSMVIGMRSIDEVRKNVAAIASS